MSSRAKSGRDAPVNLTSDVMRKEDRACSATCNYSYQYNTSTCNVFHKGSYLRIPYDSGSGGIYPARYNGVDYKVEHIHIYQPSLHRYDGTLADAELLAYHSSADGRNLIVSIPINVGNGSGKQSSDIMNTILQNLPGKSSTAGKYISDVNNFNLGNLIPKEGFFTYVGRHLLPQFTGTYNYIVYHKKDAIMVYRDSLTSLIDENRSSSITKTEPLSENNMPKNLYYYNKRGANNAKGNGDIYIKCNPTGEDGTVLYQQSANNGELGSLAELDLSKVGLNWETLLNNDIFRTLIGTLFGLLLAAILFYMFRFIFNRIGNKVNASGMVQSGGGGGGGGGDGW
jgi:carbonic anhydrase